MIAERYGITSNSVQLKDELQKQPDLEVMLNEPEKKDQYVSNSEYLDNECSKILHTMKSNSILVDNFQERLLKYVNAEVDDLKGMHVVRLSSNNMGGCHNLQDLVRQANKEICSLNEVLDLFPDNGHSELFEQEMKQYGTDVMD